MDLNRLSWLFQSFDRVQYNNKFQEDVVTLLSRVRSVFRAWSTTENTTLGVGQFEVLMSSQGTEENDEKPK